MIRSEAEATPAVAMTIAGTDSGGGAGIAADLKTFAALGVFGTLVVTAVTAQNTLAVTAAETMPREIVDAELDAVLADFPVVATKTGMLASAAIVGAVTERARSGALANLVVDPVMVAASGAPLIPTSARTAYLELIPFAAVLTPNLAEAEALLDRRVRSDKEMEDAARALCDLGAAIAIVKGGHRKGDDAADAVCVGGAVSWLHAEWIETSNLHGTGCTLSAAIAAHLALGREPLEAIRASKAFLSATLARSSAVKLGGGPGPLARLGMAD